MHLRHYVSVYPDGMIRYTPSTRGSMRSWQYDSAVSDIAISSSVNKLLEPSGSFQSKGIGACRCRFPKAADKTGLLTCRTACLHIGRSMLIEECGKVKIAADQKKIIQRFVNRVSQRLALLDDVGLGNSPQPKRAAVRKHSAVVASVRHIILIVQTTAHCNAKRLLPISNLSKHITINSKRRQQPCCMLYLCGVQVPRYVGFVIARRRERVKAAWHDFTAPASARHLVLDT